MFLREKEDLVVEESPVAGILADGNDGDQEARGSSQIRCLFEKQYKLESIDMIDG